jgi:XTP/dITP diphosphohydrolase
MTAHSAKILVATMNRDKAAEIAAVLGGSGVEIVCLADFPGAMAPEETGATLEDNALLKARAGRAATGLTALADDTGLEVDALDGAPGVFSSRFAGENATYADNCRLLAERLRGVPPAGRGARFRCVVALAFDDGSETTVDGTVAGRIIETARGQGGFGYDPLFEPDGGRLTYAEMSLEEKNRLSHRAVAVRKAAAVLAKRLQEGG